MSFSQTTIETADIAELCRLERETLDPDPLKAAVLRALRPSLLRCGVCEKPTAAVLNVGNVTWVCLDCFKRFQASAESYPRDVLDLEDALEEARRTR